MCRRAGELGDVWLEWCHMSGSATTDPCSRRTAARSRLLASVVPTPLTDELPAAVTPRDIAEEAHIASSSQCRGGVCEQAVRASSRARPARAPVRRLTTGWLRADRAPATCCLAAGTWPPSAVSTVNSVTSWRRTSTWPPTTTSSEGLTPEQARRAAVLRLGSRASLEDQHREARGLPLLEAAWQDVRLAVRMLFRAPWFAGTAILTLALGIANTSGCCPRSPGSWLSARISTPVAGSTSGCRSRLGTRAAAEAARDAPAAGLRPARPIRDRGARPGRSVDDRPSAVTGASGQRPGVHRALGHIVREVGGLVAAVPCSSS